MRSRAKDRAFLIKCGPYGDSSLIIKAFAREHGLISLLAKGVRAKPEASLLGPLNLYEFSFYEPRESGLALLAEFSLLEEFDLADRIECWTAATCALELYSQLLIPADENPAWFELLRDYLLYLGKLKRNSVLIWWRFLLRVFRLLGIPFDTRLCSACLSTQNPLVAWEKGSGRLICAACHEGLSTPDHHEPLSSTASGVLRLLPVIGEHLSSLRPDRASVACLNSLFASYYQAHFHKPLRLRGLEVLEQLHS